MILQPPARPFEGVVEGEGEIGVPFIRLRGALDIDFPSVNFKAIRSLAAESKIGTALRNST